MRRQSIFVLAMISIWFFVCSANADLYGTGQSGRVLLRINPLDGSSIIAGRTRNKIDGLAYNSADGYLYGTGQSGRVLLRINPLDGSSIIAGRTRNTIDGLAFDGVAFVNPTPSALVIGTLGLAVAGYRLRKRKTT